MAIKKYRIALEESEVKELQTIVSKGSHNARTIARANILLMANENGSGKTDKEISEVLMLSVNVPGNVRKRYHKRGGIHGAIYDLPRPGAKRKLTERESKEVEAIACSDPPKGRGNWTLDLIKDEANKRFGKNVGQWVIWSIMKKSKLKPWREKNVVYSRSK